MMSNIIIVITITVIAIFLKLFSVSIHGSGQVYLYNTFHDTGMDPMCSKIKNKK